MATRENLFIAALDGTARRLLGAHTPRGQAITAIQEITTDPKLLGLAAGSALGSYRHDPTIGYHGDHIAELLIEAGADPEVMETRAAEVTARLSRDRPGIGNSQPPGAVGGP
jgi:hypothetical protein